MSVRGNRNKDGEEEMIKTKLTLEIELNIDVDKMKRKDLFLKWLDGNPDKINDAVYFDVLKCVNEYDEHECCVSDVKKLKCQAFEE